MTRLAESYDYETAEYVGLLIEGNAEKSDLTRIGSSPDLSLNFEGHMLSAPSGY